MSENQGNTIYDLIIMGAGPAGLFGGYYAGLLEMRTLVIEQSPLIGGTPTNFYAQKTVYDYPGTLTSTGAKIVNDLYEQFKTVSSYCSLLKGVTVTKVDPHEKSILLTKDDGSILECKHLLLCTGTGVFAPILLEGAPRTEKITYMVRNVEDFHDRDVVVLGGGDSAVDWANMISKTGKSKSVTIVHRRAEWPAKTGNVAKLDANGVKVLADTVIKSVSEHEFILQHNQTKEEVRLPYDIALVQYGQRVTPTCIHSLGLKEDKYKFVVHSNMQTSAPNIFAAGNCCVYHGKCNTIVNALAEAVTAVVSVHRLLNPKNVVSFYSSLNEKK